MLRRKSLKALTVFTPFVVISILFLLVKTNSYAEGSSQAPIIWKAFALAPKWVEVDWYPIEGNPLIAIYRNPGWVGKKVSQGYGTTGDIENYYVDESADPDTSYTYSVCAEYPGDPACSSVSVKTPPLPPGSSYGSPTVITGSTRTTRSITVQWGSSHNYDRYLIRWGIAGSPDVQIPDDYNGYSYPLKGLLPNTTYSFKVKGCDIDFWGTHHCADDWAQVFVKTKAAPANTQAINDKYEDLLNKGVTIGDPITGETVLPDRRGHYVFFQGGAIYWTPDYGAYAVFGSIRDKWVNLGAERSSLGYPKTDEQDWNGSIGRISYFECGYITYTWATGQIGVSSKGDPNYYNCGTLVSPNITHGG